MQKMISALLAGVFISTLAFASDPPKHQRAKTIAVAISGSNASQAIVIGTKYRIWASTACFVNEGADATTSLEPLAANVAQYFTASAATLQTITSGATGTLFITPVN